MEAGKRSPHPAAWSRFFRRLLRPFLGPADKRRVAEAIAAAELRTTGEIHVHIIDRMGKDAPLERARALFKELGLDRTDGRNGVLILIAHLDHSFAIWGDEAVHAKAGEVLWTRAAEALRSALAERRYADGVVACVEEVGRELALHFPKREPGPGRGQLPDEVSES